MTKATSSADELAGALKGVMPEERVHTDELTLTVYARAADFFEYRPQAVVKARTEEEVRGVLRVATEHKVPVTFRAAGTSLSGQVLGTGIICDISTGFQGIEPRDGAKLLWTQPGPTGELVDRVLEPLGRRIGPDPASLRAARIGGMISNNSSGMTCGVKFNAYHTLHSMRVMLLDGSTYDSAIEADHTRFEQEQERLANGLLELRREVLADADLVEKIRKKFSIKCVTGYGINALVDFERPLDIFIHLMVGGEGTLGFLCDVVLETLPLDPARSTSLLLFTDISKCAAAVPIIEELGAQALEFMDDHSLQAIHIVPNLPDFVYTHPEGSCGLLIDFWRQSNEEVDRVVAAVEPKIRKVEGLINMSPFTRRPDEHRTLWESRSNLLGLVASNANPGETTVVEDMAVPLEELVPFVEGLQANFEKHGLKGYINGHASAGNLHFIINENFNDEKSIAQYDAFIQDVVSLIADQLHGSLKAEHGTGRAIAPFVEREWGSDAYSIMKRIKNLADPECLLNPDVIISDDPNIHCKNFKPRPQVWSGIDECMECGFCEHTCPSRLAALTPRQRIQASRMHAYYIEKGKTKEAEELWSEYQYAGIDMCAADGMCHTQCPVHINTGVYTDYLRQQKASYVEKGLAAFLAKHFGVVEEALRGGMNLGTLADRIGHFTDHVTKALRHLVPSAPVWSDVMGKAPPSVVNETDSPDFVYYPACVSRIMGSSAAGKKSVAETMLEVGRRAGFDLLLARDVTGTCCSQIWEHKGFETGRAVMANRIVERMWNWSKGGRVPIICDVSTCTLTLTSELAEVLSKENKRRYSKLHILDVNDWLKDDVMPKLEVRSKKDSVVLHPTCGCVQIGSDIPMREVAEACATRVTLPLNWGCCGVAGDRGFLHPELSDGAQHFELEEVARQGYDGYYSVARTCEIGLSQRSGQNYESIVYLVEEATR
ncbi:FAD-binding oxidoreductase [Desulfobacterota bacterium AH_259_B03_O07]|nr:FAD-binding oxidoreductase [Desulfobacterota bacterium AH_259_B03_O07]